jgi:hypothetical protein
MHILWHYLFDIFRVVIQYWRGFQPPMILTTVQKKSDISKVFEVGDILSLSDDIAI